MGGNRYASKQSCEKYAFDGCHDVDQASLFGGSGRRNIDRRSRASAISSDSVAGVHRLAPLPSNATSSLTALGPSADRHANRGTLASQNDGASFSRAAIQNN